ncbi:hypothetical protein PVAP13_5KG078187 [Panicum virgatum]|uniref:Uncharacterized protein n=1 Tax=Panicum virgatum TaxID=38727 RepID=A0A8T0SA59_PANVG|nr:hypothetical protein PVAP13_5KG078187 [Panicum virgatum]
MPFGTPPRPRPCEETVRRGACLTTRRRRRRRECERRGCGRRPVSCHGPLPVVHHLYRRSLPLRNRDAVSEPGPSEEEGARCACTPLHRLLLLDRARDGTPARPI